MIGDNIFYLLFPKRARRSAVRRQRKVGQRVIER